MLTQFPESHTWENQHTGLSTGTLCSAGCEPGKPCDLALRLSQVKTISALQKEELLLLSTHTASWSWQGRKQLWSTREMKTGLFSMHQTLSTTSLRQTSAKQRHSLLLEYDYMTFDSVPLRPANNSLDFCNHSNLIYIRRSLLYHIYMMW